MSAFAKTRSLNRELPTTALASEQAGAVRLLLTADLRDLSRPAMRT